MVVGDAPPNYLEDSNTSLKMKIVEEEGVGVRSLIYSISRVRRMCSSFGMGSRMNDKQVNIRINLHKLNNKLING
jgi:hypothetical protein